MQCGQLRQSSGAQNISAEHYIILLKELSYILQNFLIGQMTKHCIIIVGIDGRMLVLQVLQLDSVWKGMLGFDDEELMIHRMSLL